MNATGLLAAHRAWVAQLHAAARQPPARPRRPLWWRQATIGSIEPALHAQLPAGLIQEEERAGERGFELRGEALTPLLALVADALRAAGLAHAWRDEQLAVTDPAGQVHGTVERAVVRPLGIATRAVHLVGLTPDGEHWVQQRSFTKPNDPGLWDTLMGGMVPASDTPQVALERETWEEAGLHLAQLHGLERGGTVRICRPTGAGALGYVVEDIDWWRCVVPAGVVPVNQDGEVAQFCRMAPPDVVAALLGGAFTLEAALVFAADGL